jgi:hypothetical protein
MKGAQEKYGGSSLETMVQTCCALNFLSHYGVF